MRRRTASVLACLTLFAGGAVAALAVAGPIIGSSHNAGLRSTILVNTKGLTLYHLSSERTGSISCSGICATFWIPVVATSSSKPSLGKGVVASKVGTIKRPDGKVQLTYNHYALYRYYLDKKPGQTGGEGFATGTGSWYAISTSGAARQAQEGLGDHDHDGHRDRRLRVLEARCEIRVAPLGGLGGIALCRRYQRHSAEPSSSLVSGGGAGATRTGPGTRGGVGRTVTGVRRRRGDGEAGAVCSKS